MIPYTVEDFTPPHFSEFNAYGLADYAETPEMSEGLEESTEPLFGGLQPKALTNSAVQCWLNQVAEIPGFVAAVLIDTERELTLGAVGDCNVVEAAHSTVRVAKAIQELCAVMEDEGRIEEVTTVGSQMQFLQSFEHKPDVFVFVAFDHTNIGQARHQIARIECPMHA